LHDHVVTDPPTRELATAVALYLHRFPSAEEAARMHCTCAAKRKRVAGEGEGEGEGETVSGG
jgi:hypothetical protein